MRLSDFDYDLPPERIAQHPVEPRDASRLLVLHRDTGAIEHRMFRDLSEYLRPGDVLVLNQTRVIPARLPARKLPSGGAAEILLLRQLGERRWLVVVGGKRIGHGTQLEVGRAGGSGVIATVIEARDENERVVEFDRPINPYLKEFGETPLPPYITVPLDDPERYQTVFARYEGSAAAPTAGLHFTGQYLIELQRAGIQLAYCTLHIGLDTFAPVREENIADHKMHTERAVLKSEDAEIINNARLRGGRIVAVGTTAVRTLETAAIRSLAYGSPANDPASVQRTLENFPADACPWRPVIAIDEDSDLFITPGFRFRAVDILLTNFHLPRSTLLMLVSAFAGRERILSAYREAIARDYRFYSLGDACLLL
ncbi:MAG TPA: tRNA preQ1(34) S-adenosylmethionine ribosyltransferase-isomerase QueA [Aggregatilineaceae bacterium]|jgi:S-adenosylmethionine:tRNA ribosyltransferase-isomerase|nr:tRNA preQ1(34) S-adenosylmethionine ribosyltransferase-isomerase QueA [Anaerolineae bacterium]HMM27018.1 tRNA preQ1(34) S-adenosylmethionine ribosyltransferase-isomerase QueA [Aggregatilineaceae bacterium]